MWVKDRNKTPKTSRWEIMNIRDWRLWRGWKVMKTAGVKGVEYWLCFAVGLWSEHMQGKFAARREITAVISLWVMRTGCVWMAGEALHKKNLQVFKDCLSEAGFGWTSWEQHKRNFHQNELLHLSQVDIYSKCDTSIFYLKFSNRAEHQKWNRFALYKARFLVLIGKQWER